MKDVIAPSPPFVFVYIVSLFFSFFFDRNKWEGRRNKSSNEKVVKKKCQPLRHHREVYCFGAPIKFDSCLHSDIEISRECNQSLVLFVLCYNNNVYAGIHGGCVDDTRASKTNNGAKKQSACHYEFHGWTECPQGPLPTLTAKVSKSLPWPDMTHYSNRETNVKENSIDDSVWKWGQSSHQREKSWCDRTPTKKELFFFYLWLWCRPYYRCQRHNGILLINCGIIT